MRLVGIFGCAATRINDILKRSGFNPVVAPEGFFVEGKEGPLKEGGAGTGNQMGESDCHKGWTFALMNATAALSWLGKRWFELG
ncbi:MAG: hypothetical protein JTT11_00625 [Candidatus Brockarchaeota archaeon]|nr:hypothetical protein [Candidatus Brockarchaeota archaeon]